MTRSCEAVQLLQQLWFFGLSAPLLSPLLDGLTRNAILKDVLQALYLRNSDRLHDLGPESTLVYIDEMEISSRQSTER